MGLRTLKVAIVGWVFRAALLPCVAQSPAQPGSACATLQAAECTTALQEKLDVLAKSMTATRRQLEDQQRELDELRGMLLAAKPVAGSAAGDAPAATPAPDAAGPAYGASVDSGSATGASSSEQPGTRASLEEQQEVLQAEVRQHAQTKVETESKYPLRVYGLLLFQSFSNAGIVDNPDLPSVAIYRGDPNSGGTVGASVRQSLLGVHAEGPHVLNARTAASVDMDFFGGFNNSYYGSSSGIARLRTADVALLWTRTSVHAGISGPLISPLSPTSYATVAQPSLSWGGNLWNWAPQLRVEHVRPVRGRTSVGLEAGLWDAPLVEANFSSVEHVPSPAELSRTPGFEGRVSMRRDGATGGAALGVGGFFARERYPLAQNVSIWNVTGDWQIPMGRRLQVTGEVYRGVGLGNFGGGAYKDVLTGTDLVSRATRTIGLNAAGGWAQLKTRFSSTLEANATFGIDNAFASDFRRLNLAASSDPLLLSARNRMMMGNVIFRPKTYLIVSPEYRHIDSWRTTGDTGRANLFTMTLGYAF